MLGENPEVIGRNELISLIENTVYKMMESFFDKKFKELENYLENKLNNFKKDAQLHQSGCKAYNMWDKEGIEDFYRVRSEIKKHVELHKQHEEEERLSKINKDRTEDRQLTNKRIIYSLIFTPIVGLAIKVVYDFLYWIFNR